MLNLNFPIYIHFEIDIELNQDNYEKHDIINDITISNIFYVSNKENEDEDYNGNDDGNTVIFNFRKYKEFIIIGEENIGYGYEQSFPIEQNIDVDYILEKVCQHQIIERSTGSQLLDIDTHHYKRGYVIIENNVCTIINWIHENI